jgi:hypothetical protein
VLRDGHVKILDFGARASPAVKLGTGYTPAYSPDGSAVLAIAADPRSRAI